jgi:hypothetical protein
MEPRLTTPAIARVERWQHRVRDLVVARRAGRRRPPEVAPAPAIDKPDEQGDVGPVRTPRHPARSLLEEDP